jgi:hypothetical protein
MMMTVGVATHVRGARIGIEAGGYSKFGRLCMALYSLDDKNALKEGQKGGTCACLTMD